MGNQPFCCVAESLPAAQEEATRMNQSRSLDNLTIQETTRDEASKCFGFKDFLKRGLEKGEKAYWLGIIGTARMELW